MSAIGSEALYVSEAKSLSWSRAITAGLVATIVITISLALFGMNIMKSLGVMLLPNAGTGLQYLAGGVFHLLVGLFYGVVYAWLFGRVRVWGPFLKGAIYGLALTAIALAVMPLMAMIMPEGKSGAMNPCNPCVSKASAANPCNPCATRAENPCNPCAGKAAASNPCKPANACSAARTGNPCNPCGGGAQSPYSGAISAINHLLYGLALAFTYRAKA